MHSVLLVGAGKIGTAIARFLSASGDYDVLVADQDQQALNRVGKISDVQLMQLDVANPAALSRAVSGRQSVVSAVSFNVNPTIAQATLEAGASYFDLTEDVATTKAIRKIAKHATKGQIFMPQCGLAPGFVSIAAHHLTRDFEKLDDVKPPLSAFVLGNERLWSMKPTRKRGLGQTCGLPSCDKECPKFGVFACEPSARHPA